VKTALLIIDVQNDYFPNGKMELNNSINVSINIKELLNHFRSRLMPILHIQHISIKPGATFFLPDTPGVEFHDNVKPQAGEKVFVKYFPNSFRDTKLHDYLKESDISRLVIAGMMTHMCVDTTVRAAYDLGYECIIAGDCCATKSLSFYDTIISAENVQYSFLAALNGVFSQVLTYQKVIDVLK
jgi:nicotinamidase-related amidase